MPKRTSLPVSSNEDLHSQRSQATMHWLQCKVGCFSGRLKLCANGPSEKKPFAQWPTLALERLEASEVKWFRLLRSFCKTSRLKDTSRYFSDSLTGERTRSEWRWQMASSVSIMSAKTNSSRFLEVQ